VRDRLEWRIWRHVPIWGISVGLIYRPCRVACPNCGIKVEAIPWASGKSSLSLPLIVVLATWGRLLAWEVVAKLFHVSWSTVRASVQAAVAYGLAHRDLDGLAIIGVDEISRQKGHVYHTQVYDLSQKRLLWSGDGKDANALRRFFEALGPERCAAIRGACCDMSETYAGVIREMLPNAILVFDKFHLIRKLLDAVNTVRKEEAAELKKTHPDLLVGTRYLFLKNLENLKLPEQVCLSLFERLNLKSHRARLLKELFRQLWTYRCKGWAKIGRAHV
jgi:transposase